MMGQERKHGPLLYPRVLAGLVAGNCLQGFLPHLLCVRRAFKELLCDLIQMLITPHK